MTDTETTATETTATAENTAVETQATPTAKTFTQDELNAIIDKRLERERRDAQARIDKAVTEAQKLAKMSADERAEHEKQAHEKALADREAEITKRELRAEAKSQLSDKGLPIELAEILPYTDADTTNAAIVSTEKVFRAAVEKAVTERLKGNAPKVGSATAAKELPDPDKLDYKERAELYRSDPATYKKLFGGD